MMTLKLDKPFVGEYTKLTNKIRNIRKNKDLTQEMLSEKTGLSISYIKQLESNREYKNLTFETMVKLSKGLDVEIADLFKEDITD